MMQGGYKPPTIAPGVLVRTPESIDRDVRTLQQALRIVLGGYGGASGAEAKEKLSATEWLRSFRSRDDSWDACIAVLGAQRGTEQNQVSFEEQVFASQAILYKCRRRRAAITSEDVSCLLRLALAFIGPGLRPVLTQLCLGICACAVRHVGWKSSKVLPDMVSYCHQASADAGPTDFGPRLLMLEILTVLPDEVSSKSGISAHPDRRAEFLRALRSGGGGEGASGEGGGRLALRVLSQLLEPGGLPTEGGRAVILRCALAWVQLEAIEWGDLLASPVMALALDSLEILEACDEACELLTVSLEAFSDPGAVHEMLPRILAKRHGLVNPASEDVCRCLATVFSTAACAYLPCILRPELAGLWGSLLQVMVAMLEHASLEIAALALNFWGLLGELLVETANGNAGGEQGQEGGQGQGPRSPALEESVRHACLVAMMRAQLPPTGEGGVGAWEDDAKDELENFREEVQELFKTLILPASPKAEQSQSRGGGGGSKFPSSPHTGKQNRTVGGGTHHRSRGGSLGSTGTSSKMAVDTTGVSAATPIQQKYNGAFHNGSQNGNNHAMATNNVNMGLPSSVLSSPAAPSRSLSGASPGQNNDGRRSSLSSYTLAGTVVQLLPGVGTGVVSSSLAPPPRTPSLSPVQLDILAWLETLAATTTLEALKNCQHAVAVSSGGGGGEAGGDQRHGHNSNGNSQASSWTNGVGHSPVAAAVVTGGCDWARVEVLLRALSSVSKAFVIRDDGGSGGGGGIQPLHDVARTGTMTFGEHSALQAVVQALPALPPRMRELQRSVAVLVGGLAPWIARRPRCLEPALNAVLGALSLEEDGASKSEVSMRDKGEDHVGAVSLSKLASAAGAALVAVPTLPTHLLMRYVDLSSKLQQHRLNSSSALSPSAQLNVVLSDSGGGTAGIGGAGGGRACHHPMPEVVGTGGIIIGEVAAAAVGDGRAWPDGSIRSNVHSTHPPLHASSLRLFLGCLVKMLGEQQNSLEHVGGSRVGNGNGGAVTGGNPGHREGAMIVPGNVRFLGNVAGSRGGGGSNGLRSGGGEVGEVLRTLVKGEARSLGGVLDRRRQLASIAVTASAAHDTKQRQNRIMGEIALESLSNLALILRKSDPTLDSPGLVAAFCGGGGDGGGGGAGAGAGRGLLVDMVEAFGEGEEKVLSGICQVFEALVWAIAERLRQIEVRHSSHDFAGAPPSSVPASNGDADVAILGVGSGGGELRGNNAESLKLAVALGDALAQSFLRRPSVRFLETLRCITKELATFDRHSPEAGAGAGGGGGGESGGFAEAPIFADPNFSLRACDWVNQCLYSAATGAAAAAAAVNAAVAGAVGAKSEVVVVVAGGGGWGGAGAARGGGGPDAHPEMVEAVFTLMREWINELPVPSLRWLEAWLDLAVSGMTVRHRGPARAVLNLIQACCAQRSDPTFTTAFSALLRDTRLGLAITRGLLSGLCGAMPSWMLDDLVATIRALFDTVNPASVSVWVEAVLQDSTFERYGVSDEGKIAFVRKLKEDLCCKDWRAFKAGLKAFCGGKKKGTGGTPPVHAAHANRQQQQQQQVLLQQQAQQPAQADQPAVRHSGEFRDAGGVVAMGNDDPETTSPFMLRSMTM